jgi:uncharacterized protein (DUF342 family)
LGERHDAKVAVAISADDMSAEVTITDAQGGKEISVEGLIESLRAAGVVSGIDEAVALSVCQASGLRTVPIARGAAPQDGIDAIFEELIPDIADRAPKLDESGSCQNRGGTRDIIH